MIMCDFYFFYLKNIILFLVLGVFYNSFLYINYIYILINGIKLIRIFKLNYDKINL